MTERQSVTNLNSNGNNGCDVINKNINRQSSSSDTSVQNPEQNMEHAQLIRLQQEAEVKEIEVIEKRINEIHGENMEKMLLRMQLDSKREGIRT